MKYLVIIAYLIIAIVQILTMKGQKSKKELAVALFLTLIASLYTYGYLSNWKLPTIDSMLQAMFDPVSQKVFVHAHTQ